MPHMALTHTRTLPHTAAAEMSGAPNCLVHITRSSLLQLSGVEHLTQLLFLDVSHNQLHSIDSALLPPSIAFLQVGCHTA